MKRVAVLVLCLSLIVPAGVAPTGAAEGFSAKVSRIPNKIERRMRGKSWHKGCPVPIRNLRLIRTTYHAFDGSREFGRLVVHKSVTDEMVYALRKMWRNDFRIRKMYLVDRYEGSDKKSMRADNTSAFNCRYVSGTTTWSQHAYGKAIDINPVENPYVAGDGSVSPKRGTEYKDRTLDRKGMIHDGDAVVRAFEDQGWGWGGYWSSSKDYQHFSESGT